MAAAQAAHAPNTMLAVGSYGPRGTLGKCYQADIDGSDWKILIQAINEDPDVVTVSFNIQTEAGGFGFFNACAMKPTNGNSPMFSARP